MYIWFKQIIFVKSAFNNDETREYFKGKNSRFLLN